MKTKLKALFLILCITMSLALIACDTREIEPYDYDKGSPNLPYSNNDSRGTYVHEESEISGTDEGNAFATGELHIPCSSEMINAMEVVRSLQQSFNEVESFFRDGGLRGEPFVIHIGEVVSGTAPIEYEGRFWSLVRDERFPYLRTVNNMRDKIKTVFSEEYAQRLFDHLFCYENPLYRDINGLLHINPFVEFIDAFLWDADYTQISSLATDSFIATVRLYSRWDESVYYFTEYHFKLTQYGWRINDIVSIHD